MSEDPKYLKDVLVDIRSDVKGIYKKLDAEAGAHEKTTTSIAELTTKVTLYNEENRKEHKAYRELFSKNNDRITVLEVFKTKIKSIVALFVALPGVAAAVAVYQKFIN